ncbi:MAG: type II secretion system protein GspM [Gammaproteobacteria bacterium]|nr:type II secretion system protein GspM [Gammaproteobacteria bacterium]
MNWNDLSDKKKANFLVLGGVISLFLLFVLVLAWLNSENNTLTRQLDKQRILSQSLVTLQNSAVFPTLSTTKAKNIIRKTYRTAKRKKIRIDGDKRIAFSGSKMLFSKLLNGLKTLKTKYGIVAIDADIKRNSGGVVDAKITFTHP